MLTMNHFAAGVTTFKNKSKIKTLLQGRSVIVEFVGPTGSGKTTNCQSFSDSLKVEELSVYMFSDVKKHLYNQSLFKRIYVYSKAIVISFTNLISYTFLLLRYKIFSFDSIYRYIKLCIFNEALQLFIKEVKPDVVLLDQWIIQGLWSATIFKLDSYLTLPEKLSQFYFKTDIVIYFDLDTKTATERIAYREHGDSRFDKMDGKHRLERLQKYNGYLHQLYEQSACRNNFKVSTLESPDYNANIFLGKLKEFIMHTQP
jgi:thymidylate kinase